MTRYEDDTLWYKATDNWIMLTQLDKKHKLSIFHWFKGYIDAFYPYKPAETDGVSLKIEEDDKLLRLYLKMMYMTFCRTLQVINSQNYQKNLVIF